MLGRPTTTTSRWPRVTAVDGCDLWGFSEVQNAAAAGVLEGAVEQDEGADFESVLGTTGGGDRLLIVYNADRFEYVDDVELDAINIEHRVRAPLAARLRDRGSGAELLFPVNHPAPTDCAPTWAIAVGLRQGRAGRLRVG